jgi:hypothetical protein
MSNCTSTGESEKSGTEANVFTLSGAQALTRIGVFTCEAMSHVKADVYLLDDGAANPADGSRLLTEEADVRWAGYHLLPLSEEVTIPAGKSFSVVVTITGPKGTPYTPFEYGGTDPFYGEYVYVTEENEAGRSYILTDDGWVDLKDYPMDPQRFYLSGAAAGNALIRVFTKDAPEPEKDPLAVDYAAEVSEALSRTIGRKVRLIEGKKGGRIEIEYVGADDREALIELLQTLGK